MLKFAADENFDNRILRGMLRGDPDLDAVRVQDSEVAEADDPVVLDWLAREGRVLLTHDARTMTKYAYDRVRNQQPMPGVIEVNKNAPMQVVIDDLLLLAGASLEGEWENRVGYIPLRN